jgi:hypothetical protein
MIEITRVSCSVIIHPPILVIVIAGSQHADAQHRQNKYCEYHEYSDCDFDTHTLTSVQKGKGSSKDQGCKCNDCDSCVHYVSSFAPTNCASKFIKASADSSLLKLAYFTQVVPLIIAKTGFFRIGAQLSATISTSPFVMLIRFILPPSPINHHKDNRHKHN